MVYVCVYHMHVMCFKYTETEGDSIYLSLSYARKQISVNIVNSVLKTSYNLSNLSVSLTWSLI